jgi:RND family efflux transporter MFP subunit
MNERTMRTDRRLTFLVIPLAALALAACSDASPAPAAGPTPVRVEQVRLEPADAVLRYAAVIRPRIEAEIGFRIGGKMVQRLVETGTRVAAGTPLAKLDPTDIELQLRAVEAQLTSAKADAANARSDFQRYAQLRQGEWSTRQEYDKRKAAMETSEARVREIEAQSRVARNNAQYTTLLADGPGVVTAVLVEPGQVVAQGQTVFRIARLGELEAIVNIPEQQTGPLDAADLSVDLWSLPGVAIAGHLRELSPAADTATRTYQARITLVDPPPQVQIGMTATLTVTHRRDGRIARLPLTSLTKSGAAPAVWVLSPAGDGIELRPVEIGAYTGDRVLILAGLADGDRVVTAGVHKLDSAQKVRIWTEPDR